MEKKINCVEYVVDGMHCAACEVLIEDKLGKIEGVKNVKASLSSKKVEIEIEEGYSEDKILQISNKEINPDGYRVLKENSIRVKKSTLDEYFYAIPVALIFLLFFSILQSSGILSTGNTSDLFQTFILGVIASLSSCMALVGGLVLAISNNYSMNNGQGGNSAQILFHLGRIGGFFILGGLLGIVGGFLKPSMGFTFILTIIVSVVMISLALNQLGITSGNSFLKTPKFISKRIIKLKEIKGSFFSFLLGVLTFFLPCGFTLSVQAIALEQGSFLNSALIMFAFALGTLPVLALLSFASINFAGKFKSGIFLKTTGIIILAFALYNIYGALIANGIIV